MRDYDSLPVRLLDVHGGIAPGQRKRSTTTRQARCRDFEGARAARAPQLHHQDDEPTEEQAYSEYLKR